MWWNAFGPGHTWVQTQLPHLAALGPACEAGIFASRSCGGDQAGVQAPGPGRGLEPDRPPRSRWACRSQALSTWAWGAKGKGCRASGGGNGGKQGPPHPPPAPGTQDSRCFLKYLRGSQTSEGLFIFVLTILRLTVFTLKLF